MSQKRQEHHPEHLPEENVQEKSMHSPYSNAAVVEISQSAHITHSILHQPLPPLHLDLSQAQQTPVTFRVSN
jgi:hypothetical protein